MAYAAKQKILIIIFLAALAILAILFYFRQDKSMNLKIGGTTLRVELASSFLEQAKGLSGRDALGESQGMLFVYRDSAVRNFWMKDMLFSIDAVWINKGKIVGWQENISPPKDAGGQILRFHSLQPADMVLEAPSGWVKGNNIRLGQGVDLAEN